MTKISRYAIDDKVTGSDKWIGSDAQTQYTTKNFTPTKLAVYFNENQIIDIGTPIRYKYDILEIGDVRLPGTITFDPQVGTPYSLSNISSFILSKHTLKGNDVTQYLNFLIGSKVLIYKADDINIFGLYNVVSLIENITEPAFFDVVVSYITGNGSIVEDKDYLISLIDITSGNIPTKTSDLINDGEDGINPFITLQDIPPSTTPNLNSVLLEGNTSLLDAKIGELYLYDTTITNYGKIQLNNNVFTVTNSLNNNIISSEVGTLRVWNTLGVEGIFNYTSLTGGRIYNLPDNSGTIALTSDLASYVPYTGATGDINIGNNSIYTDGGAKLWNNGIVEGTSFQFAGYVGSLQSIASTNKSWLLPDASGTIALTSDIPTKTSDLINDGEDGINPFITLNDIPVSGLTSVGLTMPIAFNVANSPLTSDGTIAVSAAGTSSQYIRGDGQLATLPSSGGGGSSVFYYLNGSIAASVATYNQLSNTAVIGTGTDFTLTGNGLISQFLTDIGNPNRLQIPSGAWNFEMFFSMSSSGGTPKFYVELLKYNGTTFTTIANNSAAPETISGGTSIDLYLSSLAVPETTLLLTDRLAIRVYIVNSTGGRTATLHTENSHLCQITTTFASGISALNGLTSNNQYLTVGTSGTNFNISSVSETHTFNLPTASATNRGALSTTDWTAFNGKFTLPALTSGSVLFSNGTTIAQDNANFFFDDTNNRLGIGTNAPSNQLHITNGTSSSYLGINSGVGIQSNSSGSGLITAINVTPSDPINGISNGANFGFNGTSNNFFGIGLGAIRNSRYDMWFQTGSGNGGGYRWYIGTSEKMTMFSNGNLSINNTTDNGSKFQIKAGGSTSTDIAIKVRNATDTSDLLSFNGLGNVTFGNLNPSVDSVIKLGVLYDGIRSARGGITWHDNTNTTGKIHTEFDGSTMTSMVFGSLYNSGYNSNSLMVIRGNGNIGINEITPTAKLHIKAPGALSTDIALRVRNSADTGDLLLVRGDNFVTVNKLIPTEIVFNGGAQQIGINGISNLTRYYSSGLIGQKIQSQTGYNLLLSPGTVAGQTVVIESTGGSTPSINNSAILQANSTTQGFLPPRMTNAQRIAIATPAVGLCVYCTDVVEGLYINKSTGWTYIG